MSEPLCIVFDIGKTNKKALVFDRHYRVLHEEQTPFDEITDDDGFRCDDLPPANNLDSGYVRPTLPTIWPGG